MAFRRYLSKALVGLAGAAGFLLVTAAAPAPRPAAATGSAPCTDDSGWDDPTPPFHVYGDTWFVGTCGISSILITSPKGHILIDGAGVNAPPQIEANIRKLGFRLSDVRYILNTHAHNDHAGGIARLQRDTGARVLGREAQAVALERGQGDRSDPQLLVAKPFAPIAHVGRITDGQAVRLGPLALTAHATPGHTPGSTSWTWRSCEHGRCLNMVYADSLSPGADDVYRYGDDAAHPGYLAGFRASIAMVAALPCDLLLTPHPGASDMWSRFGPTAKASPVDAGACRKLAQRSGAALDRRLAKEKAKAS